jgi:hypothetical protein
MRVPNAAAGAAKRRPKLTPKARISKAKAPLTTKSLVVNLRIGTDAARRYEQTGLPFVKQMAPDKQDEADTPQVKVVKHVHFAPTNEVKVWPAPESSVEVGVAANEPVPVAGPDAGENVVDKLVVHAPAVEFSDKHAQIFGDNHIPKRYKAVRLREDVHQVAELEIRYQEGLGYVVLHFATSFDNETD